jgi:hypothetical protein
MVKESQPQFQPISMLPTIAQHIDGMVEADQGQLETLQEAEPKPHVLDDFTVNRVIQAFTTQKQDLWLFDEQLRRWQTLQLTTEQRSEVTRLRTQMVKLRQINTDVLSLAKKLRQGTIEQVLAMSDFELGLEVLQ